VATHRPIALDATLASRFAAFRNDRG